MFIITLPIPFPCIHYLWLHKDLCIEVSDLYSLLPPLNASIGISIHTLFYGEYKAELMLLALTLSSSIRFECAKFKLRRES